MINQSGPDGCTEQTSGLDLLVGPPRAHSVRMGASCARARGALHAHVYSIQIRRRDNLATSLVLSENLHYFYGIYVPTIRRKMTADWLIINGLIYASMT